MNQHERKLNRRVEEAKLSPRITNGKFQRVGCFLGLQQVCRTAIRHHMHANNPKLLVSINHKHYSLEFC